MGGIVPVARKHAKRKVVGAVEGNDDALWWIRSAHNPHQLVQILGHSAGVFGFPKEKLIGSQPSHAQLSLVHPDDRPGWTAFLKKAQKTGSADSCYRIRSAKGSFARCFEVLRRCDSACGDDILVGCVILCPSTKPSAQLVRRTQDRLLGFVVAWRNQAEAQLRELNEQLRESESRAVKEFQAAVVALQENRARLQMVLQASGAGAWRWDMRSDSLWWDENTYSLLGYPLTEALSFRTFGDRLHPEDRDRFLARLHDVCHGTQENTWREEYRVIHPTAGERWFEDFGHVIRDATGRPVAMSGITMDVTDRKKTLARLREHEERLRLAMMAANQCFYDLDVRTGECVVGPEFHCMLGYRPEVCVETRGPWLERLHPNDREAAAQVYREYIMGSRPVFMHEFRQRTKSGDWKWILSLGKIVARSADGIPLRMLGTYTDITQRKAAEEELLRLNETLEQRVAQRTESLRESEQRFRALSDATMEGVMLSRDGVIFDCNERLAVMLGRTRESLLGTLLVDYVEPPKRELIREALLTGRPMHEDVRWVRSDGSFIDVEVHGSSPDGKDGIRLTAARDITERKAMEQMRGELEVQRRALGRYQRSAELAEVSAGVIHQISQPLTAILNNISAAKAVINHCPNASCVALDALRDSDTCLKQVRLTMERLRVLTQPERVRHEKTDLNQLVSEVARLAQVEAQLAGLALHAMLDDNLPAIQADSVQLTQALLNVLRNAIEASAGAVNGQRQVNLRTVSDGDTHVCIEVRDGGSGIAEQNLPRLFEPFFSTKMDGMGVGLSLCRTIVHSHGGSIEAFNNPGRSGATFRIRLPVNRRT